MGIVAQTATQGKQQAIDTSARKQMAEDFANACLAGGVDAVKALLQVTDRAAGIRPLVDPNAPRRSLYSIADLGSFPAPSWVIPGEIPAHALTMLYGPSGSGKSFLAIDYALQTAQQGQTVIYLAAEGASGYHDRATAWCRHHKYSGERLLFDIQPLELRNPMAVQAFIESIRELRPATVYIDTLARCMIGLDENSARDMGIAVEACATIIRETGAAVVLVHHTGKSGMSERGSSALFAACDSVISLTNDDGLITISSGKSKDSKPFADRYMRLVEVATADGRSSCVVLPSDRVVMKGAAISPTQKKILETLALETFEFVGAKSLTIQRATNIPETSLYRALGALMREGYIRQAVKGDPYYIEPKGFEALKALNGNSGALPPLPNHPHGSNGSANTTTPTHSHTPLGVGVVVVNGGSKSDSSTLQSEESEQSNELPYLDYLTEPLHGSNGGRR